MDLGERVHAKVAERATGMTKEADQDLAISILFEVDVSSIDVRQVEQRCGQILL